VGNPIAALQDQLSGEYRQDLQIIARTILNVMLARQSAMKLMICEADHFPEIRTIINHIPRLVRQSLVGYLQKQIQAGVVLPLPPDLLAQLLWGILFSYVINSGSYVCPSETEHDEEEVISLFANVFVRGTCTQE